MRRRTYHIGQEEVDSRPAAVGTDYDLEALEVATDMEIAAEDKDCGPEAVEPSGWTDTPADLDRDREEADDSLLVVDLHKLDPLYTRIVSQVIRSYLSILQRIIKRSRASPVIQNPDESFQHTLRRRILPLGRRLPIPPRLLIIPLIHILRRRRMRTLAIRLLGRRIVPLLLLRRRASCISSHLAPHLQAVFAIILASTYRSTLATTWRSNTRTVSVAVPCGGANSFRLVCEVGALVCGCAWPVTSRCRV